MAHLFISYASDDQLVAMEVCALLEARGVACWIAPRDVAPGAKWDETILDAIESSSAFLLVLTTAANESSYVSNEVNEAFEKKKTIFTFRAEEVTPGKSLKFYLGRHHWIDGFGGRIEDRADQLAASVTTLVGATAGTSEGVGVAARPAVKKAAKAVTRGTRRERLAWMVAAVTLIAMGAMAVLLVRALGAPAAPASRPTRFQVFPPDKTVFASWLGSLDGVNGGSVSPDGSRLLFAAAGPSASGAPQLWVSPLGAFAAQPLPGTEGAALGFWSPDSRSIGFFTPGRMRRVDATGGPVQTIAEVESAPQGASWGTQGLIVFSTANAMYSVSAEGGTPKILWAQPGDDPSEPSPLRGDARWPWFLPDGRTFVYTAGSSRGGSAAIYLGSVDSGPGARLVASDTNAIYASPGFLFFMREGTLLRQPFDAAGQRITGDPAPVAEQVSAWLPNRVGAFSASSTGVLTYRTRFAASTQFAWVDRAGRQLETLGPIGSYAMPALSPDERRLAFMRTDQQLNGDIWVLDLGRQTMSRFTFDPGTESYPVWSPDGSRIFYASTQGNRRLFAVKDATGTGAETIVSDDPPAIGVPTQVAADGSFLLYFGNVLNAGLDIFTLPLGGTGKPTAVIHDAFFEGESRLSPDGRWIAYTANETGPYEVYVQPFPPTGAKWQISNGGGRQPYWRADGRELFYVSETPTMYAVDIRAGSTFEFGMPHALFNFRGNALNVRNTYVPSRDGQRFLISKALDDDTSAINVVVNWPAEVAAK